MATRSYTAIVEKEGSGYVALCPELDVTSQGETVESATANGAPQFRPPYCRVVKKYGQNVGRVAVARAILKTIYAMLTKQEAFRLMTTAFPDQRSGVMAH